MTKVTVVKILKRTSTRGRLCLLSCGHEKEFTQGTINKGSVVCTLCREEGYREDARLLNMTLLGTCNRKGRRLYRLSCGHVKQVHVSTIKKGEGEYCEGCLINKYKEEALQLGITFIGDRSSDKVNTYTYELSCGHIKALHPNHVRYGNFKCEVCYEDKLYKEASRVGVSLLDTTAVKGKFHYQLTCGHTNWIPSIQVRTNSFRCDVCTTNQWDKPALFYINKCKDSTPGFEWIKVGIAQDTLVRVKQYRLIDTVTCEVLFETERFYNKFLAMDFETEMSNYISGFKIDKNTCKVL